MPKYSTKSRDMLLQCDRDIILIFSEVIKHVDHSVVCGARDLKTQQQCFKDGWSTCDGIHKKSMHQISAEFPLSRAIDVKPYPGGYEDTKGFRQIAKWVFRITAQFIKDGKIDHGIEWGGHWVSLFDQPHFQIRGLNG